MQSIESTVYREEKYKSLFFPFRVRLDRTNSFFFFFFSFLLTLNIDVQNLFDVCVCVYVLFLLLFFVFSFCLRPSFGNKKSIPIIFSLFLFYRIVLDLWNRKKINWICTSGEKKQIWPIDDLRERLSVWVMMSDSRTNIDTNRLKTFDVYERSIMITLLILFSRWSFSLIVDYFYLSCLRIRIIIHRIIKIPEDVPHSNTFPRHRISLHNLMILLLQHNHIQ